MRQRRKLLVTLSLLLLVFCLASLLAPPLMERSIAFWLRVKAARSGLALSFSEIHAPFLRPVEIRNLHVSGAGISGVHFELSAPTTEAALGLAAIFGQSEKTHLLRALRVRHARVILRGRAAETAESLDWQALTALLPGRFEIAADEISFEQPVARMNLRDVAISADRGKSGAISIGSITVEGPYLRKSFADVHGIARWDDDRLAFGSMRLLDGLTVDSLIFDLNRLSSARVGTEMSVSAFAGHIRANLIMDRKENARIWELAGTASGISLARLATALGLTEPVRGLLRASKFTFRGDPRDVLHSTASVWTELIDFAWRERKADAIMLGANYYARTMQLQQLYIKQSRNELTLSGETVVGFDWLNPDFRGDIVGSIQDLGQFAELFGASAVAFDGTVSVRGRVHTHERDIDGELAITGDNLRILQTPVDSLTARVGLDLKQIRLDQLELKRRDDFLHASGRIDFTHNQALELTAEISCRDLADYQMRLPLLGGLTGSFHGKLHSSGDASETRINVEAQANDYTISAAGMRRAQSVAFENLDIANGDLHAVFNGELVMPEPRKMHLRLSPTSDLHIDLGQGEVSCLDGILISAGSSGSAGTTFTELALNGSTVVINGSDEVKLCGETDEGRPLSIIVPPQPAPTPSPGSSPQPESTPTPTPVPASPAQPLPSASPQATAPAFVLTQRSR